jgi:glycosyltransferase involved in cell wall biosynthesis
MGRESGSWSPQPSSSKRFSIVVPCYNAAKYFEQTLGSIRKQNYANVEVIVVDGGSSDGTVEKVRAFAGLDLKIISEPDRGQLDAVQKGLRMASGDIYFWLNADDILMPDTLNVVSRTFSEKPEIDLVFSDDFAFEEQSRTLSVGATIRWFGYLEHVLFYRQMYSECIFWRGSKNKLLPESFFHLRLCTDFAFFANLRFGLREKWLPKRLGAFRVVQGQASQKFRELLKSERSFIRQSIYSKHGWSPAGVLLRRLALAPRFFALQYFYPRLERGVRRLGRILSGDAKRRAMSREFFQFWLGSSDGESVIDAKLLER